MDLIQDSDCDDDGQIISPPVTHPPTKKTGSLVSYDDSDEGEDGGCFGLFGSDGDRDPVLKPVSSSTPLPSTDSQKTLTEKSANPESDPKQKNVCCKCGSSEAKYCCP